MSPHEASAVSLGYGDLPSGTLVLDQPLTITSGVLRGHPSGTKLVGPWADRPVVQMNGGALDNVQVEGGSIGVNVRDGAKDARLSRVWIKGANQVGLWIGHTTGTRVRDLVVERAGDNGVQVEEAIDLEIVSAVLLGSFGNKALDCTHRGEGSGRGPRRVRLRHITVLDTHGYGIGLDGWRPDEGHVLTNSIVFEKPTGAGSGGFAVLCTAGPDAGSFARVVASSTGPGGSGAGERARTFPGLSSLPDSALSSSGRPEQLEGLSPGQFFLSTVTPGDYLDLVPWARLYLLAPRETDSTLWRAGLRWITPFDVLGRRRRVRRFAMTVGALG